MNIIVAGIGTNVGKTVVSAILCKALQADYWKPIQAGSLDNTDSHFVSKMLGENSHCTVWPESHRLTQAMSPHAAAAIDGVNIELNSITPPEQSNKHLIIELAGGLMVPLSDTLSTLDLTKQLTKNLVKNPNQIQTSSVILVANYYLGSINHSLLSLHLLKAHNIPVLGIIFNGESNEQSREIILKQGNVTLLAEIPQAPKALKTTVIDRTFIKTHAEEIRQHPAFQ